MTLPDQVGAVENLGRRIYSQKLANRARRSNKVPRSVFLVKKGQASISVDRLVSPQGLTEVAAIAAADGESRPGPFRGWATVTGTQAGGNDRRLCASPTAQNPYHADIVLPDFAAHDRGERTRHAQELADASCWCDSPPLPDAG